jgi:hypothetical protein
MKGKTVAVVHRSVVNPKTGIVNVVPARQDNQTIVAVYMDDTVLTQSGDVWQVKPSHHYKGAEFVTVR